MRILAHDDLVARDRNHGGAAVGHLGDPPHDVERRFLLQQQVRDLHAVADRAARAVDAQDDAVRARRTRFLQLAIHVRRQHGVDHVVLEVDDADVAEGARQGRGAFFLRGQQVQRAPEPERQDREEGEGTSHPPMLPRGRADRGAYRMMPNVWSAPRLPGPSARNVDGSSGLDTATYTSGRVPAFGARASAPRARPGAVP